MQKSMHIILFLILFSFHNSKAGWFTAATSYAAIKLSGWYSDIKQDMKDAQEDSERQRRHEQGIQQEPMAPRPNREIIKIQRDAMAKSVALGFLFTPTP